MTINIKELIEDDRLENIRVITDSKSLLRTISTVTVLDAPDGPSWLKGNELVLTSGYIFKDEHELETFIRYLIDVKACGIGIKLSRFHNHISERVISLANNQSFSIIIIPHQYVWSDLISVYYSLKEQETSIIKEITSDGVYELFVAAKWGTIHFAKKLVAIINCSIIVFDETEKILYQNMSEPSMSLEPSCRAKLTESQVKKIDDYFYLLKKGFEKKQEISFIIGSKNLAQLKNVLEVISLLVQFQRYDNFGNDKDETYRLFLSKLTKQKLNQDELKAFQAEEKIDNTVYTSIMLITFADYQEVFSEIKTKLRKEIPKSELTLHSYLKTTGNTEVLVVLLALKSTSVLLTHDIYSAIRKVATNYKNTPSEMIAVGEFYRSLTDIITSYTQANRTLAISHLIFNREPLITYDQVALYDSLALNNLLTLNFFEIELLLEDKEKDNFDRIQTLEVFLEERNYKRAADRLYLHENTLRYRIQKIAKLLKSDFENNFLANSMLNKIKIWRLLN